MLNGLKESLGRCDGRAVGRHIYSRAASWATQRRPTTPQSCRRRVRKQTAVVASFRASNVIVVFATPCWRQRSARCHHRSTTAPLTTLHCTHLQLFCTSSLAALHLFTAPSLCTIMAPARSRQHTLHGRQNRMNVIAPSWSARWARQRAASGVATAAAAAKARCASVPRRASAQNRVACTAQKHQTAATACAPCGRGSARCLRTIGRFFFFFFFFSGWRQAAGKQATWRGVAWRGSGGELGKAAAAAAARLRHGAARHGGETLWRHITHPVPWHIFPHRATLIRRAWYGWNAAGGKDVSAIVVFNMCDISALARRRRQISLLRIAQRRISGLFAACASACARAARRRGCVM